MSTEIWQEYYERLADLVREHRTTLVFVNTRRLAERLARHLSERLGDDAVTAHHGSLSKERRLDAETRLKNGALRVLVATASLELGIDIGHVDLVCQIGSPHRIATLLQRVGRSGHTVAGTPKGRVFPTSRDDLVECIALLRSVRSGDLDRIVVHDAPSDVLAQQIVAETACREYTRRRAVRGRAAGVAVPRPRAVAVRRRRDHARRGVRDEARAAGRVDLPRRGAAAAARPPGLPDARADVRRRDSGGRRLPDGARARRHVHRHAERRLRHREHGRRRHPARQHVVARAAGGRRRHPRRRCEGRAAEHPVLARRSAGAKRRALDGGQPAARRHRALRLPGATTIRRTSSTWLAGEAGIDRGAAEQTVAYLASHARRARRRADAGHAGPRALLRRVGRHAARAARAVRQPHQQGVGPRAAQAVLPSVQLRAAGGGDRGRAAAVARAPALVSARGRLPLPAPGDRRRRARAGAARRADVRDAVALEHDHRARGPAVPRRAQGAASAPAHARRRSARGGVSRRGGVPRKHSRRSPAARPSAGRPDGPRLPRRRDGCGRPRRAS